MNKFMITKWLALAMCLCSPMVTYAASSFSIETLDNVATDCSYSTTTHELTFAEAWSSCNGWWFSSIDFSAYSGAKIVFTTSMTSTTVQLVVQYNDNGSTSSTGSVYINSQTSDEQTLEVSFNESYSNDVMQIYLQASAAGSITLVSAELIAKTSQDVDSSTDFDISNSNEPNQNWGSSGGDSYSYDASGNIVMTFNSQYTGIGWQNYTDNYGNGWDLSDYDAIVVTYEGLTSTSGSATIGLYLSDGTNSSKQESTSDSSGTITFTFENHSTLDYSTIHQIIIQPDAACSVTITSITFVKYSTSSGDGSTEETNPYISVTEDGAFLNFTTSYVKWNSEGDDIVISTDDVPNTATLTIGADNWSGGVGCSYSTLDITDYYQMVVHYSVTATDTDNQESINAKLILYSGWDSGQNASLYDSENTGTMRFTIKNAVNDFDPSSIIQIVFQANHACTINVTSIQLLTEEEAATNDEDMLYSTFYLWDNVSEGCTKSNSSYNADTGSGDSAPFNINNAKSYDGGCWWFGDVDEDQYWGIEIKVKTTENVKVRIAIQYAVEGSEDYTEKYTAYCTANEETTLILPFLSSYDHYVDEVFIQLGQLESDETACDITVTSAKLIGSKNETYQGDYVTILTSDTDGWATYYLGTDDYRMPLGLEGTTVTGTGSVVSDEDDENLEFELTTPWEYKNENDNVNGGDIVPKGTPLVLKGVGDEPYVTYTAFLDTTGNGVAPTTNWLHGKDDPATADEMIYITSEDNDDNGEVDYYYFKLSYNSAGEVGFFAGADNCAAFSMTKTHKAWLAIEQSVIDNIDSEGQDGKFVGFHLSDSDNSGNAAGDESTTGITAAPVIGGNEAIYNLQGVRVNDMSQKGIYIVEGKKIVKQ